MKHLLSKLAYKVTRVGTSYFRYIVLTGTFPRLQRKTRISEYLLERKLLNDFSQPQLCGKLEGSFYASMILGKEKIVPKTLILKNSGNMMCFVDQILLMAKEKPIVLKPNHACAKILIITPENRLNFSKPKLNRTLKAWLSYDYSSVSGESIYRHAQKLIIAEESISGDRLATDLKIHCFNGQPKVIQYLKRGSGSLQRLSLLLDNGRIKKAQLYRNEVIEENIVSLELIRKAISDATLLSRGMKYVRVDFFMTEQKYYFAEFTFLPAGGCMPLLSRQVDEMFYKLLTE